ncbi:thioredoxin family protein [Runella sp.]|uniref:thioredoxin family protein n=1 Tax=Runella sp. TaxID=1960881 RepID=UPI003D0D78CA
MTEVTDNNFEAEVLQSQVPVVVFFYMTWAGPCKVLNPIVLELENSHQGRVKFVKLDIEANVEVRSRYGVKSVPFLMKFENGEQQSQTRRQISGKFDIIHDLSL